MESKINPHVPAIAKTIENPDRIFSAVPIFFANRPVCRNHRSAAKERSRKTVVTQQPAMNKGCRP